LGNRVSEKGEAIADGLEAQFRPVTVPLVPAVIEMVNMELRSYLQTPISEPLFTNPDEVQHNINGLKMGARGENEEEAHGAVGRRGTTSRGTASHHSKGKRKANELASSGDTSEPATRRPAPHEPQISLHNLTITTLIDK